MSPVALQDADPVAIDIASSASGCARCSPDADVIEAGDLFASVPLQGHRSASFVVCLPCVALLMLERWEGWIGENSGSYAPIQPEVAAKIRAAARPEAQR